MKTLLKNETVIKYVKSLRVQIFAILVLVGILPIFLVKQGILSNYESQAIRQREILVKNQCASIAGQLGDSGYLERKGSDVIENELSQLAMLYSGRIVIANSQFIVVKDTARVDENKILLSQDAISAFQGVESLHYYEDEHRIEMSIPVRKSGGDTVQGVMVVSTPTEDILASRDALGRQVFVLQFGMVLIIILVAFFTSRMLVKPFRKVTSSLERISEGSLEEDLSILDYTETELLSEAYNRMRQRMKSLDDSRQEFVSNVSHELKTPITSMKVLADSLLMQEDVPVELYKEFMGDIAEEVDRENKIINDLLSLVKMDRKAADVNIQDTSINDLMELILKRLRPIAAKRDIDLVLESFKPVRAMVDETKLTLAISNLVENAIKYNKDEGWVHISLNADQKYFYVKVEDSGIGIPEEATEHIFERFYRVDKSHSREIGGTGLGLAITRSAILMHRGAIRVYSKEGEGTTFTVRIPLVYTD